MSILTIQLDLRLRVLTPEGLDDVVTTFSHYDLPLDAAGHDWTEAEQALVVQRVLTHFTATAEQVIPSLVDHCRFEQPELPFG